MDCGVNSLRSYRRIPKICPGAYTFQRPFLRGLSTEGNLRFKFDWAILLIGREIWFFALRVWGGGGAYIWRGLYMEGLIFGMLR